MLTVNNLKILLTLLVIIISFGIINKSNIVHADNNIPIGCPGSLIQGPPTPAETALCATIPIGCPGSTIQGPPAPGFDKSKCPYSDGTATPTPTPNSGDNSFKTCDNPSDCDITQRFIDPVVKILTGLVGLTVTIMIVVAGIQYSSAGSDPQKVAAAKSKITNAIIALVTYIFLFGLLQWLWPGGIL